MNRIPSYHNGGYHLPMEAGVDTIDPAFLPLGAGQQITSPDGNTYTRSDNGEIIFVVNGVQVGQTTIIGGMTKWTLDGILDPIIYAGTPRTIAQRDAITFPQAGYLVYIHDGLIKEYQYFDGIQWKRTGVQSIFDLQNVLSPVGQAGNLLTVNPSENGIEYTKFVDAFNQTI